MPRNLLIFVGALVLVALLCAGLVWWLGPGMVRLAFFDDQRDQPYVVFDLFSSDELGDYSEQLDASVVALGGEVSPRYRLSYLAEGSRTDERLALHVVQLAHATEAVQVFTSSQFREQAGRAAYAGTKFGSYEAWPLEWPAVMVVWLAERAAGQELDPFRSLQAALVERPVYRSSIQMIEGEVDWRDVLVIAFDDYVAGNGEQGAKEAGRLRLEGKDYIVQEGDVMHFRFNV